MGNNCVHLGAWGDNSSLQRSLRPEVPDPPPKMYIPESKRTEVCARRGTGNDGSDRFEGIRHVQLYVCAENMYTWL